MSREDPLGKAESERLEFKGRDVLDDLDAVSRSVVSLLNAKGGTLWIGVREEDGTARAVEGIECVAGAIRRIHDHLVDAVEPSFTDHEVAVEPRTLTGRAVVRVRVKPDQDRQPYSRVRRGGRWFDVRIGARTRLLDREEIADRFRRSMSGDVDRADAVAILRPAQQKAAKDAAKDAAGERVRELWMGIRPAPAVPMDVQAPGLRELLTDPSRTGVRRAGWVFVSPYFEPKLAHDRIEVGSRSRRVVVRDDGTIEGRASLDGVMAKDRGRTTPIELVPHALTELPTSLARIAAHAYQDARGRPDRVVCGAGFLGLDGIVLRPYSVNAIDHQFEEPETYNDGEDLLPARPFELSYEEFAENPDELGRRIARWVYQSFGFSEDAVPSEFDRTTHRLVLRS